MDICTILKNRNILSLNDLNDQEMLELVELAAKLKTKKYNNNPNNEKLLSRKNICLVFEKSSTRTRCASVVAGSDEGANVEYLSKNDIHFGKKESIADSARVLGRMFDGILYRGFGQTIVEELAEYAGVPVWNGLTIEWHPTQILADLLTIKEKFGSFKELKVVYMGDGHNNVCNSLMLGCAKAGIDMVNCCPPELAPCDEVMNLVEAAAKRNDSTIEVNHDPKTAVEGANVIYTDVWVSMGEDTSITDRTKLLMPYQVNMDMIKRTGNLEKDEIIFLHCLPAFHNNKTHVTAELGALEVTDDVFEASFSKVFDEAENRMHTIKAMMVATM